MNPVLLGIVGYVIVQLLIVFTVARRVRGEADYLLAGRRFGPGLATFAIFATWFGAETCIGAAGRVYEGGLFKSIADPFGYSVCLLLMGLFYAGPLWRRKLTTLADLYRQRYSPGVERAAALLLIPTSVMWAAAQVRALGQVLSSASEFDVELAIAIAAGVVVVYTVYGGLMADAISDLMQGTILMIGLVILLVAIVSAAGGIESSIAAIDPQRLQLFGSPETPALEVLERWAVPIAGSTLAQELVAVILASRAPEVARRSAFFGTGLYFVFGLIPVVVGLIGVSLLPGLDDPEQLLPQIAQRHLTTIPYIIFVGAIVSAILSTVAGALLAAAALTEHNLVVPLLPSLSSERRVLIARVGVVIAGIAAYVLARGAESVYALVEDASAFGSAGIFTVATIGLFSNFGGIRAAYAALATGCIMWLAGNYYLHLPYPYLTSLAVALGAYVSIAVLDPAPPKRN